MKRQASMLLVIALGLWVAAGAAARPIFDAHLHYSGTHAQEFTPEEIIEILDRNRIVRAVVSSTPNAGTKALYQYAPERIVPFLSLYRSAADKLEWPLDEAVPERAEAALENGIYRGIGELHIFARQSRSPVFRRVVEIAYEHGLILQVHGDPPVIDVVFEYAPDVVVIWAHAGTFPFPEFIAQYLDRYPNLFIDTSVRDGRIAPEGELAANWRALFTEHSDRVVVGVDTFSPNRWRRFDEVTDEIRGWLDQLPEEVARKLAYENASRLFGPAPAR
jgi:hypothetical protein